MSLGQDEGGFFGWLRGMFGGGGGRRMLPDGRQLVSRVEAAKLCAHALLHAGIGAAPTSPAGDAGRVTVALFLARNAQPLPIGWIEIPLSGEMVLSLDDSALAAQYAGRIGAVVSAAFQKLAIHPMPADERTLIVGSRRIVQAAIGTWVVLGPEGTILASADTAEEAARVAQAIESQGAGGQGAGSEPLGTGNAPAATTATREQRVEMERAHAARWLAMKLREHGFEARAADDTITLALPGLSPRIAVPITGPVFDDTVPNLARAVVDDALGRIQLVEHLE